MKIEHDYYHRPTEEQAFRNIDGGGNNLFGFLSPDEYLLRLVGPSSLLTKRQKQVLAVAWHILNVGNPKRSNSDTNILWSDVANVLGISRQAVFNNLTRIKAQCARSDVILRYEAQEY